MKKWKFFDELSVQSEELYAGVQRGLEVVHTLGTSAAPLSPILKEILASGHESVKATILELDLLEMISSSNQ